VRESARDSFASKLVAQYEETGRLDESSAAQALRDDDAYLTRLADRMESEVRRVREEWEAVARAQDKAQEVMMEEIERLRAPGSVAAIRGALNQLRDWALLDINENAIRSDEPNYRKLVDGIVEITNAALAAPARNCDVGTAQEQAERFKAFCLPRVGKCSENSKCPAKHPCNQIGIQYCQLKWAQMPYKPEGDAE
jgi:hypothetical protein